MTTRTMTIARQRMDVQNASYPQQKYIHSSMIPIWTLDVALAGLARASVSRAYPNAVPSA